MIDAQDLAILAAARGILTELQDANYGKTIAGQAGIGRDVILAVMLTLKYQHGEDAVNQYLGIVDTTSVKA